MDHRLGVGEGEGAVRETDVPLRRPASSRGKLTDVISRTGATTLSDPLQLSALPLRRVDDRDQSFQERVIARPQQQHAPRLARVGGGVRIESEHQDQRITDQLVAQDGQLHTEDGLNFGAGPFQIPEILGLEPGSHHGQATEIRRLTGRSKKSERNREGPRRSRRRSRRVARASLASVGRTPRLDRRYSARRDQATQPDGQDRPERTDRIAPESPRSRRISRRNHRGSSRILSSSGPLGGRRGSSGPGMIAVASRADQETEGVPSGIRQRPYSGRKVVSDLL